MTGRNWWFNDRQNTKQLGTMRDQNESQLISWMQYWHHTMQNMVLHTTSSAHVAPMHGHKHHKKKMIFSVLRHRKQPPTQTHNACGSWSPRPCKWLWLVAASCSQVVVLASGCGLCSSCCNCRRQHQNNDLMHFCCWWIPKMKLWAKIL